MTADILTVMWKERKGLFRHRGSRLRAALTLLIPLVMMAIYFPWQIGASWLSGPWSFLASGFVPMIVVGTTVCESFAGERERHTLATLLASRLPDRAILFGKLAMAVAFAWLATIVVLAVGLLTVNIAHWGGQVMFYSLTMGLGDIALSFLVATLGAAIGVLISLRAATVQEAQQIMMAAVMVAPLVLGVIVTAVLASRTGWGERVEEILAAADSWQVVLAAVVALVLVDAGLIRWAMARFQRARLILD